MNYLLFLSCLACLIALSVVRSTFASPNQEEIERELRKTKLKILSKDGKIEPSEMYLYLREMDSLRDQYKGNQGYFLGSNRESDKDMKDLIEAFDISEKKCNTRWFSKLNELIEYHESRIQIYNYLSFLKVKLGQFCMIMLQNENQPDYFGLERGRHRVKGMITDRFWL